MQRIELKNAPVNCSWGGHAVIDTPNLKIVLPQRDVEMLVITLYDREFHTGPGPQRQLDERLQKKIENEKNEAKKLRLSEEFVYGVVLPSLDADDMAVFIKAIYDSGMLAGQNNLVECMKSARGELYAQIDRSASQNNEKVRKNAYRKAK